MAEAAAASAPKKKSLVVPILVAVLVIAGLVVLFKVLPVGAWLKEFQTWVTGLGFAGYVLYALSRISEGAEHSERVVMQELVTEASRSLAQLSPIDSLKDVLLIPLGRLRDRRLRPR